MTNSEQFRAECEARFWLAEYHKREAMEGKALARQWWQTMLDDLTRKRSQRAVDELRRLMNQKEWPHAKGGKN